MKLQKETFLEEVNQEKGIKAWLLRNIVTRQRIDNQVVKVMEKVNDEDKPEFISMFCGLQKHPAKWLREHLSFNAKAALADHITCHCLAITGCKDLHVRNDPCRPEKARNLVPNAASIETH